MFSRTFSSNLQIFLQGYMYPGICRFYIRDILQLSVGSLSLSLNAVLIGDEGTGTKISQSFAAP